MNDKSDHWRQTAGHPERGRLRLGSKGIWQRPPCLSNLLNVMELKHASLSLVMMLCVCSGWAQSQAALDKVLARYSAEQVEDMRAHANYRFEGSLLFYAESFLVKEEGVFRNATEAEIASIDLHQYDGSRAEVEDVVVFDSALGTDVLLRSREHFEAIYLSRLNDDDREAYRAYKAMARPVTAKTQR